MPRSASSRCSKPCVPSGQPSLACCSLSGPDQARNAELKDKFGWGFGKLGLCSIHGGCDLTNEHDQSRSGTRGDRTANVKTCKAGCSLGKRCSC